jgi:[ribosomal protein S18]-alanine N-acetyltransferase
MTLDSPKVNVRLAITADIAAMIELERQCETAAHWSEGQYKSALPACGTALTARLVLVIDGKEHALGQDSRRQGTIAGFLVARPQGSEWELENIVVTSATRRKGLGSRLLEEFLRRAENAGVESVHLEVRESNQAAQAFYEKWGFEETGRRKGYYANPDEDAVLYRRIAGHKGLKTRP